MSSALIIDPISTGGKEWMLPVYPEHWF